MRLLRQLAKTSVIPMCLLSTGIPSTLCQEREGRRKDPSGSFLKDMAKSGREAMDKVDPDLKDKLSHMLPEGTLNNIGNQLNNYMESGAPTKLGYGFLMGYSSGFCVKRVSRLLAFVIGGFFIGIQAMAYNGYATIDQDRIKEEVNHKLDLNGDGVVDKEDALLAYEKLKRILTHNGPTGGGFTAGLLMGLKT